MVRRLLFVAGYRFWPNRCDLLGTPDIVLLSRKIFTFVHGCFWHAHKGCKYSNTLTTRSECWAIKLEANAVCDQLANDKLTALCWRVLCVWECATRDQETVRLLKDNILGWINDGAQFGEIG